MDNLYGLITTIINNPALYLGKPSVQRLYAYIGGYLHHNDAADDHCLDGFNEYIAACYQINSDHNWADIIEFFSQYGSDEIAVFKKHFYDFVAKQK